MSERDTESYRHTADLEELQQDFARVDRNGDGHVNYEEFKELLEGLEAGMTEEEMQIGFRELDTNRDGLIDTRDLLILRKFLGTL